MSLEQDLTGEEIIHIIPLGYEIDRATKYFERHKANKAYILATTGTFDGKYTQAMTQKQLLFVNRVEEYLKHKDIEFEFKNVDLFDSLQVARNISNIIVNEQAKGNLVYVNVSSAGRLTSVVATLAAMAHNAKAYYIMADGYSSSKEQEEEHGLSICDKLQAQIINNLPLQLPNETELNVLICLCQIKDKAKIKDGINMVEIEKSLGEMKTPGYEKCAERTYPTMLRTQRINCHMKLKGILEKLTEKKYITTKKVGKQRLVKINPTGIFIANISGKMVEKESTP